MQREREIEEEVEQQRRDFWQRVSLHRRAGNPLINEGHRQRAIGSYTSWDPLAQFNTRTERIFQEAKNREIDELAAQMGRLRIFDPQPRLPLQRRPPQNGDDFLQGMLEEVD